MIAQAAVSLLNIGARRLARRPGSAASGAGAGRRGEPAASATSSRCATRSTARGRCWRSSSAACPQELRPLRDALSQLQMAYAREAHGAAEGRQQRRRGASAPAAAPERSARGRGSDRRASEQPAAPGPAQRAAGCGCPAAEGRAGAPALRPAASPARHDRLPRAFAPGRALAAERSGRRCARERSSRGTPIRPRRISVE